MVLRYLAHVRWDWKPILAIGRAAFRMKLGDRGSEILDIWYFIYGMDELTEKEVDIWIRSIATPCDGSGSRSWDDLVQGCHGDEFTRHHGFSDVALGYLLITNSVSTEDSRYKNSL